MNSRKILSYGLTALVLGGAVAGAATGSAMLASAAEMAQEADARRAASEAEDARKDLARGRTERAVSHAEAAVGYDPRNAEHRALLGQAYLMSGRFASAGQALGDALALDPANGRVALNLALAQIALGEWATARATLETHEADIPASDRGLAFALAGDPVTAVQILTPAARAADADAKTRQNLALSLALAGRWQEAKAIAAVDVPADQLDQRIIDWASFARPTNAYDQVASLLGVRAIEDAGQPQQLALARSGQPMVAAAQPVDPLDAYMPVAASVPPAPIDDYGTTVASREVPDAALHAAAVSGGVVFGPRREIVQPLPGNARSPVALASRDGAVEAAPRASGNYYVQLGAFRNSGAARTAWTRASARHSALSGTTPSGMEVSTRRGTFYRLSVGGYARAEASALCGRIKANGGACFVRADAGDQVARWARGEQQVASR